MCRKTITDCCLLTLCSTEAIAIVIAFHFVGIVVLTGSLLIKYLYFHWI